MLAVAKIRSILLLTVAAYSSAQISKDDNTQDYSNLKNITNIRKYYGSFGTRYEFEINKDVEYIYVFTNVTQFLQSITARVVVETLNATDSNPVFIMVRQEKDVMAWQHPLVVRTRMGDSAEYQKVSRTICPSKYYPSISPRNGEDGEENLLVTASTFSPKNVTVKFSVEFLVDFYLNLSEEKKITVSPSEPSFYGYLFLDDMNTVVLTVNSEDEACTTISVQSIDCPIYDLEKNIKFEGQWETMMYKGGMTITRKKNEAGFFLVFVVHSQDDECILEQDNGFKNGNSLISFKLEPSLSDKEYYIAVYGALGLILLICIPFGTFYKYRKICQKGNFVSCNKSSTQENVERGELERQQTPIEDRNTNDNSNHGNATESSTQENVERGELERQQTPVEDRKTNDNSNHGNATERNNSRYDTLAAYAAKKKSHLYIWITGLAGIFHIVPAFQRVWTHLLILQETGDYDLCYYNYQCAYRLWKLMDFNNIYSNIGYILFGLLFLFVTRYEKKCYEERYKLMPNPGEKNEFGLFFAMGLSLIIEGSLSATYHLCPRGSNFQFDTTFMYVIAALCMVNIYQNRHRRAYANATSIFMFLGLITCFLMLVNTVKEEVASIIIIILQILVSLVVTLQLYYKGEIYIEWGKLKKNFNKWIACSYNCESKSNGTDLFFLVLVNLFNWIVALLGILKIIKGTATILLFIFIVNLAVVFVYHICIKHQDVRKKEIAESQQTTEPGKGQESSLLLKGAASDIAVGAASSQTMDIDNSNLPEKRTQENSSHRDDTNKTVKKIWNCFKAYWKIFWCELKESKVYTIIAIILWVLALYYFYSSNTSWEETPSVSRNKNKPCSLLNFYDNHDKWHFLSAGALFFTMMAFLCLDNQRLDTL